MTDALLRLSPFRELDRIRSEVNRLFNGELARGQVMEWHETLYPAVDVYNTNNELVLVAEVPGLSAENLEITTTKDSVTLAGEFTAPQFPEQAESLREERTYGRFSRSFRLPLPVDADKAAASIKDGLLIIRVPKAEEIRPRVVPINEEVH